MSTNGHRPGTNSTSTAALMKINNTGKVYVGYYSPIMETIFPQFEDLSTLKGRTSSSPIKIERRLFGPRVIGIEGKDTCEIFIAAVQGWYRGQCNAGEHYVTKGEDVYNEEIEEGAPAWAAAYVKEHAADIAW